MLPAGSLNEHIEPNDCIFCKIAKGQAPAHRVCEDERTLGFMDIFPVAEGHTLVIPKAHCTNLLDADARDLEALIARSQAVAHAIREVIDPDGIGVFQLNGAAAGQTVFHYHMHLIPRTRGDTLQIHTRTPGDPDRLAETAQRLAEAIAARRAVER
ncbi:MAG: HIT family protein [bacterium]|nr:HIT family protein [bacterium]